MNEIEIVRIDNKYSEYTLEQTCRTCSQFFYEDTTLIPLSKEYTTENNEKFNIIDKLISFDLKIQEHDGLPQQICSTCVNQVSNIHSFLELCKSSQSVLRAYFSELNLKISLEEITKNNNNKNEQNQCLQFSEQKGISVDCVMEIVKEEEKMGDDENEHEDKNEVENTLEENTNDDFLADDTSRSRQNEKNVERASSSSKALIQKCEKCNKYLYWSTKHCSSCLVLLKKGTIEISKLDYCCFYCEKIFESENAVHDHILETHPQDQPFTCSVCSEHFRIFSERRTHLQTAHKIFREFKCDICSKSFAGNSLIKKHIRTSHPDGEYKCEICSKEYNNLIRFQYHVTSHDPNKKFKCQYCDRTFMQAHHKKFHEQSHTGTKPYVCETCGKSYSAFKNFKNHRGMHVALPFECSVCKKGFAYRCSLKMHMLIHDSVRRYSCTLCKKEYIYERDLKRHMMKHGNTGTTQIKSYQCNICDEIFYKNLLLTKHLVEKHNEAKPFNCNYCEKSYLQKPQLSYHMYKKHNIGKGSYVKKKLIIASYQCSKCPKDFQTSSGLEKHMKLHSEDRKFACKECGNLYKTASNLRMHMNQVHLKKRPHSCPYCNQTFSSLFGQKLHIRFHNKEKPFKCSQCDKSFFQQKELRRHEGIHKGQMPYSCLICLKTFSNWTGLNGHNRKHNIAEHRMIEEKIWANHESK